MAHHHLALHTHTADNVAVLSVTMCRLVLIHEVHINGIIGQLLIKLRMEMQQRFAILLQSQDP